MQILDSSNCLDQRTLSREIIEIVFSNQNVCNSFPRSIVKIVNLYIILSCTHLYHFFLVFIYYLYSLLVTLSYLIKIKVYIPLTVTVNNYLPKCAFTYFRSLSKKRCS